ncbi:MAG: DUF2089 family protein [Ruminiclostridium sp.]|nr:DUF2089 family protein [Ruminiclostridium sp.]
MSTTKFCPVCNGELRISALECKYCSREIKPDIKCSDYKQSVINGLSEEQYDFLIKFLECQGNFKKQGVAYSHGKKMIAEILKILNPTKSEMLQEEDTMSNTKSKTNSLASDTIKALLISSGGRATIKSLTGKTYELCALQDDKFYCAELESSPRYNYKVFDEIVEGAKTMPDYKLPKGDGRGKKFGELGCDENTVVGRIAMYAGKILGESVDDPVSVFAAILDWAGIAENKRGYIQLTEEFLEGYMSEQSEYGKSEELYLKQLEEKFKDELIENAERGKILYGYNPKEYIRMIKQYGAVAAVKRLIAITKSGKLPDGFLKLVECNALELTMEASVCNPKYQSLFSAEEIRFCKDLMAMHKD